jgi:uncharacterized protein
MKCPACKNELRQRNAGNMMLDVCLGGCGGIWFDQDELNRVSAMAATSLHTIWALKMGKVELTEPRICPRCAGQVLERKWFSDEKTVEIDQCPTCGGIWLDDGEFSKIYKAVKGAKIAPPGWAQAIATAAAAIKPGSAGTI